MKKAEIMRQGDVLLVPIAEIPKTAKPGKSRRRRLVLAEGEATGHHHSILEGPNVDLLEIPSQQELFLLVREGDALLEHQEHATVAVPPGAYRVIRQREYTPEEIRRVAD